MKYTVRLEFDVDSIDLADVVVEANSAKEAIQKAIQSYEDGNVELDYYSSKCYDSTLRVDDADSWLIDEIEEESRACTTCGKEMTEGYCAGDGEEYYCSDECLFVDGYTPEQRDEDYENGHIYYTEWESIDG